MIVSSFNPPATVDQLLVPALAARLDRLDLLSRKVFAGKLPGERRSKRRGQSVEFDDFRPYVPGDDLRHIDWNVFARLDRFVLKLFREDQDLSLHLVVDLSASMQTGAEGDAPPKAVYAARLAAALGYIGLVNNNRVTVATFGGPGGLRRLTALRGRRGIERLARFMLEELAARRGGAGGTPGAEFIEALARFASLGRERGVLALVSDLMIPDPGEIETGLSYLAAGGAGGAGYAAACLHGMSPSERDPAAGRAAGLLGDLRLTDIETGRAAEVSVSPALLRAYRRRLNEHIAASREACRVRGIRHALLTTDQPVQSVIEGALRRGGLVG